MLCLFDNSGKAIEQESTPVWHIEFPPCPELVFTQYTHSSRMRKLCILNIHGQKAHTREIITPNVNYNTVEWTQCTFKKQVHNKAGQEHQDLRKRADCRAVRNGTCRRWSMSKTSSFGLVSEGYALGRATTTRRWEGEIDTRKWQPISKIRIWSNEWKFCMRCTGYNAIFVNEKTRRYNTQRNLRNEPPF